MNIKELASAAAMLVLILGLSLASNSLLDRYFGAACVDAKGSWVNWPWANVPTLSPPCSGASPEPRELAEKK